MHRFHYFALSLSLCQREENRLRSSKKTPLKMPSGLNPCMSFYCCPQNRIGSMLISCRVLVSRLVLHTDVAVLSAMFTAVVLQKIYIRIQRCFTVPTQLIQAEFQPSHTQNKTLQQNAKMSLFYFCSISGFCFSCVDTITKFVHNTTVQKQSISRQPSLVYLVSAVQRG